MDTTILQLMDWCIETTNKIEKSWCFFLEDKHNRKVMSESGVLDFWGMHHLEVCASETIAYFEEKPGQTPINHRLEIGSSN